MVLGVKFVEGKTVLSLHPSSVLNWGIHLTVHRMSKCLSIIVVINGIACLYCNNITGAVSARHLWSDGYYVFHMYHPNCIGNESNILECPYSKQDTVPRSCNPNTILPSSRYIYGNNDVTSVICLQGDLMMYVHLLRIILLRVLYSEH